MALESGNNLGLTRDLRRIATDIPLLANLGTAQILGEQGRKRALGAVSMIEADVVLIVHLNLLQVAQRLAEAGVSMIDIAGAGGTSWSAVEGECASNAQPQQCAATTAFTDWGIPPTAEALRLGADILGQAAAVLSSALQSADAVIAHFQTLIEQRRVACFCTGSADVPRAAAARRRAAMSHFAVIAPPFYSHARTLQALSQALITRGHRITFIQQTDGATLLSDATIDFHAVSLAYHPAGSFDHTLPLAAHPGGLGILSLIRDMASSTDMLCRELPAALRSLAVDGLIVDQMAPAGGLVAEALRLPFVSVAYALPVNREAHFPLLVMPFAWENGSAARARYASSEKIYDWLIHSHDRVLARHAEAFGLSGSRRPYECLSPLAQISQLPLALDFPHRALPAHFHATGPLREPAFSCAALLFNDGAQPRVFASLGALQGGLYGLFKTLTKACHELNAELLIAHCGGLSDFQTRKLMRAALAQADVAITYGGLNTVLDAVAPATPLLAIPLAFDQPGIAACLAHHSLGIRASRFATSYQIARHLRHLLDKKAIKQRMKALQPQLAVCGDVERALLMRQPVRAEKHYDLAV